MPANMAGIPLAELFFGQLNHSCTFTCGLFEQSTFRSANCATQLEENGRGFIDPRLLLLAQSVPGFLDITTEPT